MILTNILFSDSTSNLVYATTHSAITVLDLRTMRVLQTLENPRHYGPITSLCIDRKRTWIVVGTSTGVLTLWDKRFGLLIRSWHVGIASSGRSVRVHQCVVHPSRSRGNWVLVSVETSRKGSDRSSTPLVEVWDIEKAILVETFLTRTGSPTDAIPEPQEMLGIDAETTPAAAIAALVRSRQNKNSLEETSPSEELPQPPASDIRALVVGSDFGGYTTSFRSEFGEFEHNSGSRSAGRGYMITGSEDSKIRFWDLGNCDKTTVLSGLELDHEKPWYKYDFFPFLFRKHFAKDILCSTSTSNGVTTYVETCPRLPASSSTNRPPQRISLITNSQQNLLKGHQDVVSAIACIDSPFRGGVISGDRAGVIKVWRVEQVEQSQ